VPMAGFDATFRRMIFSLLGSGIAMGALVSVGLALLAFYFVLKPAQKQLVEASQLAASGRIAADVVHEINNPLGIIISRAELILDEQDLPEQVEEDVRVIRHNAGRVAAYTKGLLSFARPFSGNPEKVDLNQVVQETLGFFSKQLDKRGISLSSELHPSGPRAWAQRAQLQQILLNLIGNARDALKDGGNICVRTGMANNHQIFLEVADTGCGIAREELGKIFDPFYSTKGECGTGLGLAMCQSLVKENGGKITVASEPGIGSTFRVTLPGSLKDQS
ncbi:MAG TPA: ATP-binding protein, partial [Verrucomicrobiae bacterium]|nr:ATP-binding protein [Verrucomicrobiae bacterium]